MDQENKGTCQTHNRIYKVLASAIQHSLNPKSETSKFGHSHVVDEVGNYVKLEVKCDIVFMHMRTPPNRIFKQNFLNAIIFALTCISKPWTHPRNVHS